MTNDQYPAVGKGETPPPGSPLPPGRKRILWLHTQPEHYFNCMMDDLAAGDPYRVSGLGPIRPEPAAAFEWIAAFSYRGPGWYKDNPQPRIARTVFLTPSASAGTGPPPRFGGGYHKDWRREIFNVDGRGVDAVIVSGYGWRTHREVIFECVRRGIPVSMWSDSNLRSQRGRGLLRVWRRRLKKKWLGRLIRACEFQLTANRLGVGYWRYYGTPREKIVVCPCYSDYRRIDAAQTRARSEVLGRIGLLGSDRVLFTAARLVEAKGLDLMIEAFRKLRLGEKGWRYVIAGTGPLEGALKAFAGAELGRSIHLVGFQEPRENLALMAHADLMVLPSRYEPHGIVVPEALAAGTPVLASDVVGAARDLIQPGTNGWLFQAGKAAHLAMVLSKAIEGDTLASMRPAARQTFEAWYARTSPVRVIPEVVAGMLAGHRTTRVAAGSRGGAGG